MFNVENLPTPCYVIDEEKLIKNLELLKTVKEQSGCKILLAQKAFSCYKLYPLIAKYLDGTTASGLFEARLGHEEMPNKEVHVYNPAYTESDFKQIVDICDHIIFNNFSQFEKYGNRVKHSEIGIRINPEYSEIETEIYNPCAENSRLGCKIENFPETLPKEITGLHFHTMCEQGADVLERTVHVVEKKFGKYLHGLKWLNMGGGHHITKDGYDIEKLVSVVKYIKETYNLQVYLEPGEAVALNAGYLVTEILDVTENPNGLSIAITDASAACHMPDVLEMPYRPELENGMGNGYFPHDFRLGGPTCLAGDIIGDYSFETPLKSGEKLIFHDMAIYTMVKNNTFNGINLPSIILRRTDGEFETLKTFGYEDFKSRL